MEVVSSISVPFSVEADADNAADECAGMRRNSGRAYGGKFFLLTAIIVVAYKY